MRKPAKPTAFSVVDCMFTQIGEVGIGERNKDGFYTVAAIKDNSIEAVLEFRLFTSGNIVILNKAVAFTPRKGLATSLFKWYKQSHPETMILSDSQITPDGENFWKSLMQKFPAKVINVQTRQVYNLKQIDGETVLDPKDDNFSPDFVWDDPAHGQKWAYLIEHRREIHTAFGTLVEDYEKGWGLRNSVPLSKRCGRLDECD